MLPTKPDSAPRKGNDGNPHANQLGTPPGNQQTARQGTQESSEREQDGRCSHRRRFPGPDSWLALFTGILVIETWLTIGALTSTDEALHHTADATTEIRTITEANNRAWIAPIPPVISPLPTLGAPISVDVRRENIGHSPATDVQISVGFDVISAPPSLSMSDTEVVANDFCTNHRPVEDFGVVSRHAWELLY
jgi:hypothetical protein